MGCLSCGDEDDDVSTYALSVHCLLYLVNGFIALQGAIFVVPIVHGWFFAQKEITFPIVRGLAVNLGMGCCSGRFIMSVVWQGCEQKKVDSGRILSSSVLR
jgi:hypothetical protein